MLKSRTFNQIRYDAKETLILGQKMFAFTECSPRLCYSYFDAIILMKNNQLVSSLIGAKFSYSYISQIL